MMTCLRTLSVMVAVGLAVPLVWPAPAAAQPASQSAAGKSAARQKHPDVLAAKVRSSGTDRFDFDVTVSSPYDTPERYADAFRVLDQKGSVLGERILFHDHADEQPFTRDLYGVAIPAGVKTVVIEARDKANGYGGKRIEVALPGR